MNILGNIENLTGQITQGLNIGQRILNPNWKFIEPVTNTVKGLWNGLNNEIETNIKEPILGALGLGDNELLKQNRLGDIAKTVLSPEEESEIANAENTVETQIDETEEEMYKKIDEYLKHAEEREDTAYQRMVEDMHKAGINPNLFGGTPVGNAAASGVNAVASATTEDMTATLQTLLQQTQLNTDIEENKKDRIMNLIRTIGTMLILKR